MALLAAKALGFENGDPLNADIMKGFFDFIQLERLDKMASIFFMARSLFTMGWSSNSACTQQRAKSRGTGWPVLAIHLQDRMAKSNNPP
jgi:hypothetical protein